MSRSAANHFVHILDASCLDAHAAEQKPAAHSAELKPDDLSSDMHSAEHNPGTKLIMASTELDVNVRSDAVSGAVSETVPETGSAEPNSEIISIAVIDACSAKHKADVGSSAGFAEPDPEVVHNAHSAEHVLDAKPDTFFDACSAEHEPADT
ncbi:uncharacterized protein LAESUDRAFT_760732 [Laetiporus sulphureus 93-53]|uniref:Uncharacterized protein n=1 Tax=Laetiporus sulphureus 93-53 TaxID=1314785 RepID=A0A165DJB5_9APHY|nr:uncharacterized protein LAESUDRAFT_760732 [Laetiporus sulphureus 93-53]KZT05007.1 hypothetical protein LAESUDRAFT_760732 [Laetiporus sulphureus 93-53]